MPDLNPIPITTLRRILDALEKLSGEERAKLEDDAYLIELRAVRKRSKDAPTAHNQESDLSKIIDELTNLPSRDDAQRFLEDQNISTRKSVESIARKLDIPISKQDKLENLRDKVIEATVGARVRSQAIQGGG